MGVMKWLRGYVYVELCGVMQERFINLCKNQGIYLQNIEIRETQYFCEMDLRDYQNVNKIAHKTKTFPKIVNKIGFPFWRKRIWARKGIVFGFFSGVIIMYVLSLHVWEISFSGQSKCTKELLEKYLKSIQVETGMKRSDVDCQKIEEQLRLKYSDIGWVSAELKRTKLFISIVETNLSENETEKKGAYHLVAKHKGVVKKIITRKGTPMVKAGDKVEKGDVLISGIIELRNDADVVIKKERVCADGDVYIEGTYNYKDLCEKIYTIKQYTGNERKKLMIGMGTKKIFFRNPFKGFNKEKKYDIIANENNVSLGDRFFLPVVYGSVIYREYEKVEKSYSKEEARKVLKKRLNRVLKKKKANGAKITSYHMNCIENGNVFQLEGTITMEVMAKEYKKIKKKEWRMEETDEFDGNLDRGTS